MSDINYDHQKNIHSVEGPRSALPILFGDQIPTSLLDVGCGTGTWLIAALEAGVPDVFGIDGINLPPERLLVSPNQFMCTDLTKPVNLGRRFDLAICLEVAEHLDPAHAETLIQTLVNHADRIIFSAACPGQEGQNHVNCRWPEYWQGIFNKFGYVCEDTIRSRIWDITAIEPWYRQNVFVALRSSDAAGTESRIPGIIHPDIVTYWQQFYRPWNDAVFHRHVQQIESGSMPLLWYFTKPISAVFAKIRRVASRWAR